MARIGIDFGSSFTTMSYVNHEGWATPIKVHGREKIPTILYFPEDGGETLVGDAAYNKYQDCMDADNPEKMDTILGGDSHRTKARYVARWLRGNTAW